MIKEIYQLDHLNRALRQWICPANEAHWNNLSSHNPDHVFDMVSIENMIRKLFLISSRQEGIMPYTKIWSYEKNNFSIACCIFTAKQNDMTGQAYFEELVWQLNGKLASTINEKKILIKLLRKAEAYARSAGIPGMVISRSFNLHSFACNQNKVNNFYTKNHYKPIEAQYYKKLK